MFYKHDVGIIRILLNIKRGLEKNFDYVLVIAGDTGTGKSMWNLHLVEAWTKLLGGKVDKKTAPTIMKQVNVEKLKWLGEFKELKRYDINTFDEGAAGLGSKQYMEMFSKTLEMLFQVVRHKMFFSVIVVPNFFRLNKFFREDRLRGLVYVNKRGHYNFYTRKQVIKLCLINEKRIIKKMNIVPSLHCGSFPDYDGVLREPYEKLKDIGVDNILDEVIEMNKPKRNVSVLEANKNKVKKLLEMGKTSLQIREKLNIGGSTFSRCRAAIDMEKI